VFVTPSSCTGCDQKYFRFGFFFFFLEYLSVHDKICWGRDPNLNMKFTFLCIPSMHSLQVISYIFSAPKFWLWSVTWGQVRTFPLESLWGFWSTSDFQIKGA
jgi:hypothetical protein